MKFPAIVLAIMLSFGSALAQNPNYTYNVGGKVLFTKLTDGGVLVVASSKGLYGIKAGKDQPYFAFNEYGKVKPEDLDFIPMTPWVVLRDGGFTSQKKVVIDYMTGKKVFASETAGWKFATTLDIFTSEQKIIVSGVHNKNGWGLGVYDLIDGHEISFVKTKSALTLTTKPVIIDGGLLLGTPKSILRVDLAKGEIVWENKDADNVYRIAASNDGKEIYAFENKGNDTRIHKVSSSGQKLWNKERKMNGLVNRFEILPNGLVCTSDEVGKADTQIAFLSASDGTDQWEKAPKTKGLVSHFYIMEDGILFGMQSGGINKIAFDGKPLFKKPWKTGPGIEVMAKTPKGLIYITRTDCNILNLENGEPLWKKELKFKGSASVTNSYDAKRHRYLISTGTELMAIDENTGDIKSLATFKFQGSEYPNNLAVRESGILLSSDQNMLLLDFDGKQKFQEYYKAPGKSLAGALLAGATMAASIGLSASTAMAAQQHRYAYGGAGGYYTLGDYTSTGKSYMKSSQDFANAAGSAFAEMTKRFSATQATENSQFILTKLDDGVGLVKLNKDTGKKEKEVVLKDKKPEYEVDEIEGYLYFVKDENILAFDLKK